MSDSTTPMITNPNMPVGGNSTTPPAPVTPAPAPTNTPPVAVAPVQAPQPVTVQAPQPVTVQAPQFTNSPTHQLTNSPIGIPAPVMIKQGSKVSPVGFAIGCGIFAIILIGLIMGILFVAIQNPEKFQGIIGLEGIKVGLRLFGGLFFGLVFFAGFGVTMVNLYKVVTKKDTRKLGYIIGLIFGLIMLIGSATGGIVVFKKINEIASTTGANSALLVASIMTKTGPYQITPDTKLIAPLTLSYHFNDALLKRFVASNFATSTINTMSLQCGNQHSVTYTAQGFAENCLYMKKGDYILSLDINSTDTQTKTSKTESIILGPITVHSEMTLTPSQGSLSFNSKQNEIIIGKAPTKLIIDASKIFSDLGLADYRIERDMDGDGTIDSTNDSNISHQYRQAGIQTFSYSLPDVDPTLIYTTSFRVEQSDVPICTLTATPSSGPNYSINASFDDITTRISSYLYTVYDATNNRKIESITSSKPSLNYALSKKGQYIVQLSYITDENKQGYCETDAIQVGTSDFTVGYSLQYKGPNDNNRNDISPTGIVTNNDGTLIVTTVPTVLSLQINTITPLTDSTTIEVMLDGKPIIGDETKKFSLTLTSSSHTSIQIKVRDTVSKAESITTIPLSIRQEAVSGKIRVFPDTVGNSPFEATLDASTITVIDKDDEIIYFSRDFGDGVKNPNTSQGRVQHTYVYNEKTQGGSYFPTVTITTKKGKKTIIKTDNPILVKKPLAQASIMIDSHPAQVAKVGDQVTFSLQSDGLPKSVERYFSADNIIKCDAKACDTIPTTFDKPGIYTVKATIVYEDLNKVVATTRLTVEE